MPQKSTLPMHKNRRRKQLHKPKRPEGASAAPASHSWWRAPGCWYADMDFLWRLLLRTPPKNKRPHTQLHERLCSPTTAFSPHETYGPERKQLTHFQEGDRNPRFAVGIDTEFRAIQKLQNKPVPTHHQNKVPPPFGHKHNVWRSKRSVESRRDLHSAKHSIWAATRQNQQCGCAPIADSDQPGHPPRLIRLFDKRLKGS